MIVDVIAMANFIFEFALDGITSFDSKETLNVSLKLSEF